ncbi:MAG: hypothetical protein K2X82_13980 [Gemmataceae bacterium]|nr:hypothetical protein [Gemmataceae bacterium]
MRSKPITFLFGDHVIAAATAGRGRYGHTFGGPPDRGGAARADCGGLLIHLLHRFDLSDPAVPAAVPGVRWLPLYYCFDFRTNDLGYRLVGDEAMEVFVPADDPNVAAREEWPADGYPPVFTRSDIRVKPHPYDPTDLEDAYAWAGVFGTDRLSPADRAAARERAAAEAEMCGSSPPETDEEFREAMSSPFVQGRPAGGCLNPRCQGYGANGELVPVALVPAEPVAGVHTFGELGGDVTLIVQKCLRCHTLRVTNQCS